MLCVGILIMLCQTPAPPVSDVARFCALAKPITWSRTDSEQTRREIRSHNAKGVRLCGWGKR